MEAKTWAHEHLITAQRKLDQGSYAAFLKENQKVLSLFDSTPPADEALFNMGLLYAHYDYSGRDFKKSIDYFNKLVKLFPGSSMAGEAKIWIGLLQENERLKKEIEDLNRTINESKQIDIEIDEKKKELSK